MESKDINQLFGGNSDVVLRQERSPSTSQLRLITNMSNRHWLEIVEYLSLAVNSVAFSPDGMKIASGSHDKTVQVWDVSTG